MAFRPWPQHNLESARGGVVASNRHLSADHAARSREAGLALPESLSPAFSGRFTPDRAIDLLIDTPGAPGPPAGRRSMPTPQRERHHYLTLILRAAMARR